MLVDKYLQAEMNSGAMVNTFSLCKKMFLPILQLLSIMLTLVGANLLTSLLDPIVIQTAISSFNQTIA